MALTKPASITKMDPPQKRFVIVEGIDNSGKSTLVSHLETRICDFIVQRGEGPPKPGEDINLRCYKYLQYSGYWMFDRHPIISQPIYSIIQPEAQKVSPWLMTALLSHKPLIIYCDPGDRGLGEHTPRTGEGHIDEPEFLEQLEKNYNVMLSAYRNFGARYANVNYKIGDNMDFVVSVINSWLGSFK